MPSCLLALCYLMMIEGIKAGSIVPNACWLATLHAACKLRVTVAACMRSSKRMHLFCLLDEALLVRQVQRRLVCTGRLAKNRSAGTSLKTHFLPQCARQCAANNPNICCRGHAVMLVVVLCRVCTAFIFPWLWLVGMRCAQASQAFLAKKSSEEIYCKKTSAS